MLCLNSLPAERARGCRFAEKFESPTAVAKNRGTVVGAVPILPGKGADFSGADGNAITYPMSCILNKNVLNFVIEFTPDFASNDGTTRIIFDTTNGQRFQIAKRGSNTIYLWHESAGYILESSAADALLYWKTYQQNVIVASIISGENYLWLNGILIASSVTAWLNMNPDTLYVGSRFSSTLSFNGRITNFKIFTGSTAADLLTAQEAKDYYLRGA